MDNIPIIYSFIYYRIKINNNGYYITLDNLKEIIARNLIRNGGIPRVLIKEVINDLIKLQLIKKVKLGLYEVIPNNCYKRINNYLI